jgi:hypothetical protein
VKVRAAIFSEESDQVGRLLPVDGVVDEPAFTACGEQTASAERIQMVRQRGARHVDTLSNIIDATPGGPRANEQAKNLQPGGLTQRSEHRDERRHSSFLVSSK